MSGLLLNINKAIGLIVREYIEDNGIESKEFAKRTKISRASLYRIISGSYSLRSDTLVLLSKGINMSLSDFMTKVEQYMKKNK